MTYTTATVTLFGLSPLAASIVVGAVLILAAFAVASLAIGRCFDEEDDE